MLHAFSQIEHPFGQCGHFDQVELFEKPWFLIVNVLGLTININSLNMPKKSCHKFPFSCVICFKLRKQVSAQKANHIFNILQLWSFNIQLRFFLKPLQHYPNTIMIMGPFPMPYAKKITHHAITIC